MTFWLARDEDGRFYALSRTKLTRTPAGEWANGNDDYVVVCATVWHRVGGLRLKPGEVPRRVKITVSVKEAKR